VADRNPACFAGHDDFDFTQHKPAVLTVYDSTDDFRRP
jgi:hypothetical protein